MRRIALATAITLSGVALLGVAGFFLCHKRAQVKIAAQREKEAAKAVTSYRLEKRRCPTPDEVVAAGYVSPQALVDPWGTRIAFECSASGNVVVRSAGPDLVLNTADDITEGES